MSEAAVQWAVAQTWCGGTDKLVLIMLAHRARGWQAKCTAVAVAHDCGVDVQTAQRSIRRLLETSRVTRPERGAFAIHETLAPEVETSLVTLRNLVTGEIGNSRNVTGDASAVEGKEGFPSSVLVLSPPNNPLALPPRPFPNPSQKAAATAPATSRWVDMFNDFQPVNPAGKAFTFKPLTAENIAAVQRKYGHLDLEDQAMRFISHFTANPQKTWAGYSRLSSWFEIAEEKRKRGYVPAVNGQRSGSVSAPAKGQASVYAEDGSPASSIAERFARGDPEWARRHGYRVVPDEPGHVDPVAGAGQRDGAPGSAQHATQSRLRAGVG